MTVEMGPQGQACLTRACDGARDIREKKGKIKNRDDWGWTRADHQTLACIALQTLVPGVPGSIRLQRCGETCRACWKTNRAALGKGRRMVVLLSWKFCFLSWLAWLAHLHLLSKCTSSFVSLNPFLPRLSLCP